MPISEQIHIHLIPKMHILSEHVLVKFNMKKRVKTIPACVQVYGSFSNKWSLILLGDTARQSQLIQSRGKG